MDIDLLDQVLAENAELKQRIRELTNQMQEMIEKAAAKHRPAYDEQQQRIKELEQDNYTLRRSLSSQPDRLTSSGAFQVMMEREVSIRDQRIKELTDKYNELLYQVATKHPDETRHQTAMRYIRNAETSCKGPEQAGREK
jgi:predicted nuclease with TOPRIM domain